MNIAAADIYRYRLPLKLPLDLRGSTLTQREGLVIHLRTEDNSDGFGEVAPLPGFSPETLDEAQTQLMALSVSICGQTLPDTFEGLEAALKDRLDDNAMHPSVRFGIESALLGAMAHHQGTSIGRTISPRSHSPVRISGLLSGSDKSVVAQVKGFLDAGFTEMKLKVGADRDGAVRQVHLVNDLAYGKALLHIDANRAWDVDTALSIGKEIGCTAVSYIEEPFADLGRIPEFFEETLIPVALDESLQQMAFDEIRALSGVDILILKPTILGGVSRARMMMELAEDCGIDTVISSSFESSLGLFMLAALAGSSAHVINAAGLDTLKWFGEDLLKEPLRIEKGSIGIDRCPVRFDDIDFNVLRNIS